MAATVVQPMNPSTIASTLKVPAALPTKKIRQVFIILDTTAMLHPYIGSIMVSYLDPLLRYVCAILLLVPLMLSKGILRINNKYATTFYYYDYNNSIDVYIRVCFSNV